MAAINFTGLASGLDTRAIIDAILESERAPAERLQQRQDLFSARRAAFDELQSKLSSFESALRDLGSVRTFRGRTSSVSDESIVRATAGTAAELGVFSIEIDKLAVADKVKSEGFAASDEELVSDGTITIQSGTQELITIDVSAGNFNNSLDGVRDAINDADAGVRASILFDGTAYRLIVRAEDTGLENGLSITDSTDLNLDDGGNVIAAAQDAEFTVDGLDITSANNKVTGVIPGVTLDLLSTTSGSPVTLEIARDFDSIVAATETLVSEYNEVLGFINGQGDRTNPGPLQGDATLRGVQLRVQSLLTGGLEGIAIGRIRSLSSLGVSFDGKTGAATLDSSELRTRLDENFDEIGDLFLSSSGADNPRILLSALGNTDNGIYAVQISAAAEKASVVGDTAISSLRRVETLTITVGSDVAEVTLLRNYEIDDIVNAINAEFDLQGIEAVAEDDGGFLRLSTEAFGSAANITVESSRNDPGNGRQTGFNTTPVSDDGQDVAGTIGGEAATGVGRTLTGNANGATSEIVLEVLASTDDVIAAGGAFGSVSVSAGLIDTLVGELRALTRLGDGTLDLARRGLESDIQRLADDITRIEDRLSVRELRLIATFSAAEQAISALQAQQSRLTGSP